MSGAALLSFFLAAVASSRRARGLDGPLGSALDPAALVYGPVGGARRACEVRFMHAFDNPRRILPPGLLRRRQSTKPTRGSRDSYAARAADPGPVSLKAGSALPSKPSGTRGRKSSAAWRR